MVTFCLTLSIYKVLKNSNKCLLLLPRGFSNKNVTIYYYYYYLHKLFQLMSIVYKIGLSAEVEA